MRLEYILMKSLISFGLRVFLGQIFFIAGIGSAIEVFGKYEKVMDYEGNVYKS